MADSEKPVTWSELELFWHQHDKEHERIDRHLSVIHGRMWALLVTTVLGLMGALGWLLANGPWLK